MASKSKRVFSTPRFDILQIEYGKARFYSVRTKSAVVILPVLDGNRIVLERQYRHPAGKYLYELPAGLIEKGEAHRSAALRELKEETGYTASKMTFMFKAYTTPGFASELVYFYLAEGLRKGKRKLDKNERISLKIVKIKEGIRMIRDNEIQEAAAIAPILYYSTFK